MTTKGTDPQPRQQPNTECCMCGDLGFSDQLFQCRVCQFRSQHRYCSNLYPKDEFLRTCNWCLNQKEDSPNSSNSSSSYRNYNNRINDGESNKNRKIRININNSAQNIGVKKGLQKLMIKKPKSPPEAGSSSPSGSTSVMVSTRKRIITTGELEERLRRTRSEDIMNRSGGGGGSGSGSGGGSKPVFKNKVRRYKLLDEVSS